MLHRAGLFAPWEAGFDPTPPPPAAGEATGPPDFVGVGVQKAGTSWWNELVCAHPAVTARPDIHKERHYFARYAVEAFGADDVARYHGWFPRRPGTLAGEWTPDYLMFPWVPPLLARAAPEARVLVLLRDPVERFRSGLSFRLAQGAHDAEAVRADAVRHGWYGRHLRELAAHVDPARILVLLYERCATDPAGELARTYAFLGLDPFVPDDVRREVNTSGVKVTLHEDARRRLAELYAPDVALLADDHPELDLGLWPNFR